MVTIHTGLGGRLFDQVAECTQNALDNQKEVFLLVPQHYTLLMEKEMMRALHQKGFFSVTVLSPLRLSQRVFEQTGDDRRVRIDKRGKAMVVLGALLTIKEQLLYYQSAITKQGFASQIATLISDFKKIAITPDVLKAHINTLEDPKEKDKFTDIYLIYQTYEDMLKGQFIDGEDVEKCLLQKLPYAPMFKDTCFIVYGFDLLTESLSNILLHLQSSVHQTHVFLTAQEKDPNFIEPYQSISSFIKKLQVKSLPYTIEKNNAPLLATGEIQALEENLLSYAPKEYQGQDGSVRMYVAPTPYAEAHFVAKEILSLHHHGTAYDDMCVLVTDESKYFSTLQSIFSNYIIPHDVKKKVSAHKIGVCSFLIAVLQALASNFNPEHVINILRTGFMPLTYDERYEFENYIHAFGIRYTLFLKPFKRGKERAVQMETIRLKAIEPLVHLKNQMENAQNAQESLSCIMDFLNSVDAYKTHVQFLDALIEKERHNEANVLEQSWKKLMQLLDQMYVLLGAKKVPVAQLSLWLEAGLKESEINTLPSTLDAVQCGLMGNIAIKKYKAIFIMGLHDGVLSDHSNSILTDDEHTHIEHNMKVKLTLSLEGKEQLKRLDLYKAIANATEHLYFSYAQAMQDGAALRPLSYIKTIRTILPALVVEGGVMADKGALSPLSVIAAFDALGVHLKNNRMDDAWKTAWVYLKKHHPNQAQMLVNALYQKGTPPILSAQASKSLFLEDVFSISKLETFASCPFKHFIRYGLKPRENETFSLLNHMVGSYYHDALDNFSKLIKEQPSWPFITQEAREALMHSASEKALSASIYEIIEDSFRNKNIGEKHLKVLQRVAWVMAQSAPYSSFDIAQTELAFGFDNRAYPPIEIKLDDGARILLRGKIDRIDTCTLDNNTYLRIVDYKMREKKLSPPDLLQGTQLQLMIYLSAALSFHKGSLPAGAFYAPLQSNPLLLETEKQQGEVILKQLSFDGLALKNADVIRSMDNASPPISIPDYLKKNDDFKKGKAVATMEEMDLLIHHAKNTSKKIAQNIYQGNISPTPFEPGANISPCKSCTYQSVCRKNAPSSGYKKIQGQNLSFEDLLTHLKSL